MSRMKELAITGLGPDKPGIVAGVTEILFKEGLSLIDTSMTILEGQFAFILIASCGDDTSATALSQALASLGETHGVKLFVSELEPKAKEAAQSSEAPEAWMISVAGHDRTGITYRVCEALSRYGVNVTDLESRVIDGDGGRPVYVMMIEVTVPGDLARGALDDELRALEGELGVEIRHRPLDAPAL